MSMVMADDEDSDFVANDAEPEDVGDGSNAVVSVAPQAAGVSRVKEVIEQIDCLTARRGGTVVCQMARIQLFLQTVSTITVILEADADGSIHLPVPPEMRQGKVKVTATLISVSGEIDQAVNALDPLRRIVARGGIKSIPDPARWQRKIRQDRPLPGREE
jgi:hypothetical protein